jgi:hypothetical protein
VSAGPPPAPIPAGPPPKPKAGLLATEPVLAAWVAGLIAYLIARYLPGLNLTPEQAAWVAGAVLTVGSFLARRLVTTLRRPRTASGAPAVLVPQPGPEYPVPPADPGPAGPDPGAVT